MHDAFGGPVLLLMIGGGVSLIVVAQSPPSCWACWRGSPHQR
jgi:hypothetical protein